MNKNTAEGAIVSKRQEFSVMVGGENGYYNSEAEDYQGPCRVSFSFRETKEAFVVPSLHDAHGLAGFACAPGGVGGYSNVLITPAPNGQITLRNWLKWAFFSNPLEEYEAILRYEETLPLTEAYKKGRQCKASAIYAFYGRRSAIEHLVTSMIGESERARECLDIAYRIDDDAGGGEWVLLYVGEVAISNRRRTAAKRFWYQLGLGGYLKQSPALELLCVLTNQEHHWQVFSKKDRTYFTDKAEKQRFLGWCNQNVRAVWQEIDSPVDEAKQKVREDERAIIREFKPLLNVKDSINPFKDYISEARKRFRCPSFA
jgi:hypothetical protein